MKSKFIVLGLAAMLLAAVAAPAAGRAGAAAPVAPAAGSMQSHTAIFDKTRFLFHMGLAYYAFHHFVYKRYKEGGFARGAPHRFRNIVKAAIAIWFTYHELKKAYQIANNSHSKLLHALVSPLNALIGRANSVHARLSKGQYSDGYSGFEGHTDAGAQLADWLRERDVSTVDVVGIATDHCVRATALDATRAGFSVRVLLDLTAGVAQPTVDKALDDLREAGIALAGTPRVG